MATTALTGIVERFISPPRNEGYAILSIELPGGKRAKVCGKGLGGLSAGQTIEVTGQWTTHPRFGKQFRAADVKAHVPEDGVGLIRWLTEAAIPGVGEATARKLVQTFGPDTVSSIAGADPTAVALLGDRFAEARRTMIANRAEAAFGSILAEHGIGPELRQAVFDKYGMETARKLAENPYRLITEIDGIGFATADRMARAAGGNGDEHGRVVAAALDAMRNAAGDGHTALSRARLSEMVLHRTGADRDLVAQVVDDIEHHAVVRTTVIDEDGEAREGWALRQLDRAEEDIACAILDKAATPSILTMADAVRYVADASAAIGITLNEEQRAAAEMVLANSVSIIAGGPGTGKTTIMRVVCMAWRMAAEDGWVDGRILLSAPTGKAAQRMKESTGIDATTVHRMLEVDGETGGFVHDASNPLEAGLLAVDETSMTDVLLGQALAAAWGRASVTFVGDPFQLASVGAGNFLGDLIESGALPVTTLVQVRRQAEGSAIAEGAQAVKEGRLPAMEPGSDLMFIEEDNAEDVARIVAELHGAFVEDGINVQVLTPGHNFETGTIALNRALQEQAAIEGPAVAIAAGTEARAGDKVMQVVNDKDACIFNGDAGRLADVDAARREATIRLPDREVRVSGDALRRLALAYAITVHKSQGSEFEVVLMPMTMSHWTMLKRTLFYTGITRAKQMCIVVGSRKAVERSIANDDGRARVTTLKHRLLAMTGN